MPLTLALEERHAKGLGKAWVKASPPLTISSRIVVTPDFICIFQPSVPPSISFEMRFLPPDWARGDITSCKGTESDICLGGCNDLLKLGPCDMVELIVVDENDLLAWSGFGLVGVTGCTRKQLRVKNLGQGHWLSQR